MVLRRQETTRVVRAQAPKAWRASRARVIPTRSSYLSRLLWLFGISKGS